MSTNTLNIILDSLIIVCSAVAVLVSFSMIVIILFRRSPTRADRTALLLSANMFFSLMIGCALMIMIYGYTIYGHLHPTTSFDNPWCYAYAYWFYTSGCIFFYSYLLQAVYQLCRIVFHNRPALQTIRLYIYGICAQYVFSFLQVVPVYLLGTFQYLPKDFHCQIPITNLRGLLSGLALVHMIPVSLTSFCYIYTLHYVRKRSTLLHGIRQQAHNRRDFIVFTLVVTLLGVIIISGMPTIAICLVYQTDGQLPPWAVQFQWLTVTFPMAAVSIILIFVSPHVRQQCTLLRHTRTALLPT